MVELDKLSLLDLQKEGFPGIDLFNYPYSYTREIHLDEEVDALGCYRTREPVFQKFPIRQIVAPNPNRFIFECRPIAQKVYPPSAIVQKSRKVEPFEMPFFTSLDLQKLIGLIYALNVVLPWDHTMSEILFRQRTSIWRHLRTFQTSKIGNNQNMVLS